MIELIGGLNIMLGTWIFADGFASLWAYLPNKSETWWRNHSLRAVRCLVGVAFIAMGFYLILWF